jgi:hypothetical protein
MSQSQTTQSKNQNTPSQTTFKDLPMNIRGYIADKLNTRENVRSALTTGIMQSSNSVAYILRHKKHLNRVLEIDDVSMLQKLVKKGLSIETKIVPSFAENAEYSQQKSPPKMTLFEITDDGTFLDSKMKKCWRFLIQQGAQMGKDLISRRIMNLLWYYEPQGTEDFEFLLRKYPNKEELKRCISATYIANAIQDQNIVRDGDLKLLSALYMLLDHGLNVEDKIMNVYSGEMEDYNVLADMRETRFSEVAIQLVVEYKTGKKKPTYTVFASSDKVYENQLMMEEAPDFSNNNSDNNNSQAQDGGKKKAGKKKVAKAKR